MEWHGFKYKGEIVPYEVSNHGDIRRKSTQRILKKRYDNKGYVSSALSINRTCRIIRIHRAVAETFLNNSNSLLDVNHKDGNPRNNHVDNLEWCTRSHNMFHAYKLGRKKYMREIDQYDLKGNFVRRFSGICEANRYLGIKKSHIAECAGGIIHVKSCHGFDWKYVKKLETGPPDDIPYKEFGIYKIYLDSRIYSNRVRRFMSTQKNTYGYESVTLHINNKHKRYFVHRLVAQLFLENNDPAKKFVNHKDSDITNNNLSNLEWVTPKQNSQHAFAKGLLRTRAVSQHDLKGNYICTYNSMVEATVAMGRPRNYPSIYRNCCGRQKSAYGFIWKYKE